MSAITPQQREQVRISLIRFLLPSVALSRYGLSLDLLWQQARMEGRPDLAKGEVEAELEYLHEKGLVTKVVKTLSPENQMWRITAAGRDFAAEQGIG